ncbi:MAG: LysR substrate-binding domain-containing protein [Methyloligellaceae bacterium]
MSKATRIPSISALRAFEAVARNLNFRRAADELNVTHAAVSHQIKALEAELGVSLFKRSSRSVQLTKSGEFYFPIVASSLGAIESGTRRIKKKNTREVLRVQSYGSFNTMWLTPRLSEFQSRHPRMRVRLISSFEDFGSDGFDVGVFKTKQDDGRFVRQKLFRTEMFPVCNPELLKEETRPVDPKTIRAYRLLNIPANETEPNDWDIWMDEAKVELRSFNVHATFDTYPLARDAVFKGLGMVMARHPFAATDLQSGRLARPFATSAREYGSWYLYIRKQIAKERRTRRFCEWLCGEIRKDPTCLTDELDDQVS